MISPQQVSIEWLLEETDSGSVRRGQGYHRENNARIKNCTEGQAGGADTLMLLGECSGSEPLPYEQRVLISQDRSSLELLGRCTCPVGFNCKHVVALVLTWKSLNQNQRFNPIDQWLGQLERESELTTAPGEEALLYLIMPPTDEWRPVSVEFRVAKRKADGSWTKGRKTQPAVLTNPWSKPAYQQAADEEILPLLRNCDLTYHGGRSVGGYPVVGASGGLALSKMIETGRAFWGRERRGPFKPGPARTLTIEWQPGDGFSHLTLGVAGAAVLMGVDPPAWLDDDALRCGPLELPDGLSTNDLGRLCEIPPIPNDRVDEISRRLALHRPDWPTPKPVTIEDHSEPPGGVLHLNFDPRNPNEALARIEFDYLGQRFRPDQSQTEVTRETKRGLQRIRRQAEQEERLISQLNAHQLRACDSTANYVELAFDGSAAARRDAWFEWLDSQAPALQAAGWTIEYDQQWDTSAAESIEGELEENANGWFSLRFDLFYDGWTIPLVPLMSQLIADYDISDLPDTLHFDVSEDAEVPHYVKVPAEQVAPIMRTMIDLFNDDDALKLSRADAGLLGDLGPIKLHGASDLQKLARQLNDFSGLKAVKLPTTFKGELRNYQQQGLDWMQFLRIHQFNGILADDMGLGKTIQTLANLSVEKRAGRLQQPCLIVAPTSLMGNWRREAEQFTPNLKVLIVQGPDRAEKFDLIPDHDLVLTTYPLLTRDRKTLLAQDWHYVILDEAQSIKNPKAQAAQVARALKTNHRLCLTGTPMENHLGELWAHFDFLMPGFLSDQSEFVRRYRTPIEKHQESEPLQRLNRRISPFLLRRTKDRVAKELPPKTELLRTTRFEPAQAKLYESIRLVMEDKVAKAIAAKGLANSHIIVLDALLKLRQVCCDPRLLPKKLAGTRGVPSAKLNLLFDLLPELLEEGRRVLLFSQFTTMLGLIEDELHQRKIRYTKLTGQTRKRDGAIERFRSGEVDLFLISLKAGGVGLNLTEADTVIHYDPWWNPAVEHQASDRAHRIGQDKPVFVYKLVTEGTVEEKIVALQASKHALAQKVYGKGRKASDPPITEKTIADLLGSV